MKYLVHIRIPEDLNEQIEEYRRELGDYLIGHSKNLLHCTLMVGRFNDERGVVQRLGEISCAGFAARIKGIDFWEDRKGQRDLVALLDRSEGLHALHYAVIEGLRGLIDWDKTPKLEERPFNLRSRERERVHNRYGAPYYAEFYNPHLSIGYFGSESGEVLKPGFLEYSWEINEFFLSKKDGEWETVQRFSLDATLE